MANIWAEMRERERERERERFTSRESNARESYFWSRLQFMIGFCNYLSSRLVYFDVMKWRLELSYTGNDLGVQCKEILQERWG